MKNYYFKAKKMNTSCYNTFIIKEEFMIYNGKEIKKLGFGLMRLPKVDGVIDTDLSGKMIDVFLENGFTYFDTAYGYAGSEDATKIALVDRHPRESYQLATKLPAWLAKNEEDAKEMFYTSLKRLGVDYFDFYLLHNLGPKRTEVFEDFKIWEFLSEQKKLGKIKKLGFSMHDNADSLDKVLTKHPEVDFVQLQINYADWDNPTIQSRKCYEVAMKHNKEVVIMEPVRGGSLANPPKKIAEVLHSANKDVSYSSWAIRFAASLDNVVTVLSGMSNMEQILDNVNTMKNFKPLDESEKEVISNVQEILKNIPSVPCTVCQYCVSKCPAQIAIPDVFSAVNRYYIYDDLESAKAGYKFVLNRAPKASTCVECGACMAVCPQKINIIDELKKAVALIEE